jgi:hypothetical protein
MLKKSCSAALSALLFVGQIDGVTLVYNLKTRRSFDAPPALRGEFLKFHWLLSALPIVFFRTSHITNKMSKIDVCEDRKVGGSLFNLRYIPNRNWWFEVTTGIEKDSARFTGNDAFKASRVGFDDIVFAGGPRFFAGENIQFALYGLVGLPTRRKLCEVDRYGPLVGTRLYNAGLGAEASYSFYNEIKRSCSGIIQGRFIHSFTRAWFPVLPCGSKIQPGNFSDILVSLQFREKLTLVEFGYDGTFFTNQAVITPAKKKIKSDSFLRNSGYINIIHGWLDAVAGHPFILGAGLNVGRASQFNAKTVSAWLNATFVF